MRTALDDRIVQMLVPTSTSLSIYGKGTLVLALPFN